MPSLTFGALLHLFQAEGTYQEVIKHGLSDFLRAGDDVYLPAVADHLDRARDSCDQQQAEAEIQAALQTLEQATDLYSMGTPETLAQTMTEVSADSAPIYFKRRGYYLASISLTVSSMLSRHLGQKEQCKRSADRALGMFQRYRSTVGRENRMKPSDFYPPSLAATSTTGKHKSSTTMKLNEEQAALHKVLKKWLDTRIVKGLILLYNRW
jgi:hypothetical protein